VQILSGVTKFKNQPQARSREWGILRKSGLLSACSLDTKPWDITHDLVECLAPIWRRPIRASVATVSFKLVRTPISHWLVISIQRGESPKMIQFLTLPGSGVPPPVCISIQIIMMLGVMLILCNSQCPQPFCVYYFRGLCVVTGGASAIREALISSGVHLPAQPPLATELNSLPYVWSGWMILLKNTNYTVVAN
jgi:hypothetical protein